LLQVPVSRHGQSKPFGRLPGPGCERKCAAEDKKLYIFGYGSLMMRTSAIKTNCNITDITPYTLQSLLDSFKNDPEVRRCVALQPKFTPVEAAGISRGWYAPGYLQSQEILNWSTNQMTGQFLDIAPTYLGAVNQSGASSTCVIYPVTEAELNATDQRETGAQGVHYTKEWLAPGDVTVLAGAGSVNLTCAKIRWYAMAQEDIKIPSAQFPVTQYYVDLFVGGALELEQEYNISDFALRSVMLTSAWSTHWINDRIVAYRPYEKNYLATQITRVLLKATQVPGSPLTMDQLQHIKLVGAPGMQG